MELEHVTTRAGNRQWVQCAYLQPPGFQLDSSIEHADSDSAKARMWTDLPHRRGWSISQLASASKNESSPEECMEAAMFLQEWLVFSLLGTIASIFGVKINIQDFLVDVSVEGSDVLLVDLDEMQPFLLSLSSRKLGPQSGSHCTWAEGRLVEDTMRGVYKVHRQLRSSNYLLRDESLAIFSEILASTLDLGLAGLMDSPFTDEVWNVHSHLLLERMLRSGWCPHHLAQIKDMLDTATLEALYRSSPPLNHSEHTRCTRTICLDDNIDVSGYQTRHVHASCICEMQSISAKIVDTLLEADDTYPIVSLSRSQLEDDSFDEPFDIQIESSASPIPYAAISHVWSDGCGNQNDNALPHCQIRKIGLHALAASRYAQQNPPIEDGSGVYNIQTISPDSERVYIWIDTLCVPVYNEAAKKKAIQRMSETYHAASMVVVLDSQLSSLNYGDDIPYCHIARMTCRWTRRLWTFNEGRLARDLVFIFADGPRRFFVFDSTYLKSLTMSQNSQLARIAQTMVSTIPRVDWMLEIFRKTPGRSDGSGSVDTIELWSIFSGIKFRSTSKTEDEAICLAQIFKLDPSPIRKAPHGQKMCLLLAMLQHIPRNMIFMRGKKVHMSGYGWAPATITSIEMDDFHRLGFKSANYAKASVSPAGLVASFSSSSTFHLPQLRPKQQLSIWFESAQILCVYEIILETVRDASLQELTGGMLALIFAPDPSTGNNGYQDLKEKTLQSLGKTQQGDVAVLLEVSPYLGDSSDDLGPTGAIAESRGRYVCRLECVKVVHTEKCPGDAIFSAGFQQDQKWIIW